MRYWRPWRLILIHLSNALERLRWEWANDKVLRYLYPDDVAISFEDKP